jgi:HEAT repeat protein
MDSAPVALYFDPEMCYLFQLNIDLPVSMLTKIAESAPDVRNRTWAFNALLSHGLGDSIATALTIAQAEEPWEVRVVFFKALAKRGARYAKEMVTFVLAESDIRAVWQMLAVCAVRHPAIRELLLSFIRNPETLPVARRWAIRSLGAQRATEDTALLKELFASDDGFHELTRRGVIEAMGQHHSPTAHQFLLPLIEYGKLSDRLRPACVRALAHTACALGEMQRKFTSEAIVPLINDRIYDVRMAAVDSLVILSATDHIGDVRAAHNLFAAQDLPWLEECIAELSDSDKNGTRVLEDRIAAMQSQINGMSVSILKLESMVAALAD